MASKCQKFQNLSQKISEIYYAARCGSAVCIKANELELALDVFSQLLREGCTPNLVTFNILIDVRRPPAPHTYPYLHGGLLRCPPHPPVLSNGHCPA